MSNLFEAGTIGGNNLISGRYGELFDENGRPMQTTQDFEANIEFDKEEVDLPGQFMKVHKIMGGAGSGSFTIKQLDSALQKKIAENPYTKYNYIAKLDDPTIDGKEEVLLRGVSFDALPLINFSVGEIVEKSFDFTFDSFKYLETIG